MRRAWGLHAIVLAAVLAALLLALWLVVNEGAAGGFVLMAGFVWLPVALVYTAISTLAVALLRPGRGQVALAHAIALVLGSFAPLLLLKA